MQGKDARCVKAAQEILDRDYSMPMQACEEASFKVAFVIFVMAMLLAPSPKYGYSNIEAVFGCKNQNSKKNFRHLHGNLNLDEIKNALRLLSVNGETNLMNLIRLEVYL